MSESENKTGMDVTESHEPSSSSSGHHSHHHSHHHHHSSHHHHHHHSHHSRHRSSSQRSKGKRERQRQAFRQFFRKNRKKIAILAIAVLFCFCSIAAGAFIDRVVLWDDSKGENTSWVVDGQVYVSVSVFDQPISLMNTATKALLDAPVSTEVIDIYREYKGAENRLDTGVSVKLSYAVTAAPAGYVVNEAVFLVAEDEQMTNPLRIVPEWGEDTVECYNLKVATTYYYRLNLTFTNGVQTAVLGSFTTDEGPRVMTVSGAYNMRDVGGWTTKNGQRVRQGLLYRGCEMDGAVENRYRLDENGKSVMLTQLNIKTDMDLRTDTEITGNANVLGGNVQHTYYNMVMYSDVFRDENAEVVRKVFADLANPAQYPAYLHCTYGQDRTGTVCYLLGALLGVDEADLMKDYRLSGLHHGYVAPEDMSAFVRRIKELPAVTLQEKVEGYLLDVGVTEQQINSIRTIFLEDVK